MNSLLEEIYSTIVPSMPYIIAAYVLIMVALFVFVAFAFKRLKADERRLQALEAHLHEQS